MALITRISRLFRADIHAVLDRVEEPEVLLRQAVRDMGEELSQAQQRCSLMAHEDHQIGARLDELSQSLDTLEGELEMCFSSSQEILARTLVRRKLEMQRLQKGLSRKRTSLDSAGAMLREQIQENKIRLDAMRQKLELLSAENNPPADDSPWAIAQTNVSQADVDVAFLHEQQKRRPA